jgi:hypothetical protein
MNRPNQQPAQPIDPKALSLAITNAVSECNIEAIQDLPHMERTFALANGMQALRNALTEDVVRRVFMPLQGSPLGFRTDKDKDGGYPAGVVRECVMEAMIRGFHPVGNEMNIIAERAYFTKEGFDRKLAEFPGLTDLELFPSVPLQKEGGALVGYHATWKLNGVKDSLICDVVKVDDQQIDRRIPVKVNAGMGADAILGKAKRKFLVRIYERVSRVKTPEGDALDVEGEVVDERQSKVAQKTEDLVNKHRAAKNGTVAGATGANQQPTGTPIREPGEEG